MHNCVSIFIVDTNSSMMVKFQFPFILLLENICGENIQFTTNAFQSSSIHVYLEINPTVLRFPDVCALCYLRVNAIVFSGSYE